MLAAALAFVMAPAAASDPVVLKGACRYPRELGTPRRSEHRIKCSTVVLSAGRNDMDVLVQFTGGGSTSPVGIAGEVEGDTLTIKRLYLAPGKVTPATGGHCRIFYRDDEISGISCVGRLGSSSYVANFEAFAS